MKYIYITVFILFFQHCPLLNKLYLKPNRVKGEEAKSILKERLSSFYIKDIGDNNPDALAGDFLTPTLARIDDSSIYSRRDVENCAARIFLIGIAIDQPNIIYNRTKKASDPLKVSDPNSRILPPLFCSISKIDGLIDLK